MKVEQNKFHKVCMYPSGKGPAYSGPIR